MYINLLELLDRYPHLNIDSLKVLAAIKKLGPGVPVHELMDHLQMDKSSMSRALKELLGKKRLFSNEDNPTKVALIREDVDPVDLRAKLITLSKGVEIGYFTEPPIKSLTVNDLDFTGIKITIKSRLSEKDYPLLAPLDEWANLLIDYLIDIFKDYCLDSDEFIEQRLWCLDYQTIINTTSPKSVRVARLNSFDNEGHQVNSECPRAQLRDAIDSIAKRNDNRAQVESFLYNAEEIVRSTIINQLHAKRKNNDLCLRFPKYKIQSDQCDAFYSTVKDTKSVGYYWGTITEEYKLAKGLIHLFDTLVFCGVPIEAYQSHSSFQELLNTREDFSDAEDLPLRVFSSEKHQAVAHRALSDFLDIEGEFISDELVQVARKFIDLAEYYDVSAPVLFKSKKFKEDPIYSLEDALRRGGCSLYIEDRTDDRLLHLKKIVQLVSNEDLHVVFLDKTDLHKCYFEEKESAFCIDKSNIYTPSNNKYKRFEPEELKTSLETLRKTHDISDYAHVICIAKQFEDIPINDDYLMAKYHFHILSDFAPVACLHSGDEIIGTYTRQANHFEEAHRHKRIWEKLDAICFGETLSKDIRFIEDYVFKFSGQCSPLIHRKLEDMPMGRFMELHNTTLKANSSKAFHLSLEKPDMTFEKIKKLGQALSED